MTQSGGGLFAANQFQRGSEIERAFTQFLSDAIKAANLLDELVQGWKGLDLKDKIAYMVWGLLLPAAGTYVIRSGFEPLVSLIKSLFVPGEEPKWEPEELLKELILQNSAGIPIVNVIVDGGVQMGLNAVKEARGLKINKSYQQYLFNVDIPALGIVESAGEDLKKILNPERWEKKAADQIFLTYDLIALTAGLPGGGQVRRTTSGWKEFMATRDPRRLVFPKSTLERKTLYQSMAERLFKPRRGGKDMEMYADWYKGLDEDEKRKFKAYVNAHREQLVLTKAERERLAGRR